MMDGGGIPSTCTRLDAGSGFSKERLYQSIRLYMVYLMRFLDISQFFLLFFSMSRRFPVTEAREEKGNPFGKSRSSEEEEEEDDFVEPLFSEVCRNICTRACIVTLHLYCAFQARMCAVNVLALCTV